MIAGGPSPAGLKGGETYSDNQRWVPSGILLRKTISHILYDNIQKLGVGDFVVYAICKYGNFDG